MKNITLRVDEQVLAEARKIASEESTSVNTLVREYLSNLVNQKSRAVAARKEILSLSRRSAAKIGKRTWTRENLYEG